MNGEIKKAYKEILKFKELYFQSNLEKPQKEHIISRKN